MKEDTRRCVVGEEREDYATIKRIGTMCTIRVVDRGTRWQTCHYCESPRGEGDIG